MLFYHKDPVNGCHFFFVGERLVAQMPVLWSFRQKYGVSAGYLNQQRFFAKHAVDDRFFLLLIERTDKQVVWKDRPDYSLPFFNRLAHEKGFHPTMVTLFFFAHCGACGFVIVLLYHS